MGGSTLACCLCRERWWDSISSAKREIRLSYPLGRMKQWFGCHEDCLDGAASFTGDRRCVVCRMAAGRTSDLQIDRLGQEPRDDRRGWAHVACLERILATGFKIELDPHEPIHEREGAE